MAVDWLTTKAGKLVNRNSLQPVVLRGMSLFWSQWMSRYYSRETVTWLAQDWGISVIRCAVGVEPDGYLQAPQTELDKLHEVIEAAIDNGIYVLIDWHTHNAHPQHALTFFQQVEMRYRNTPNLLFELWNEPDKKYTWAADIKPYHQLLINTLHRIEPRRVLVLGTENYCQGIDIAADDPIKGKNLLYAMHYYAASHKAGLRRKTDYAIRKDLPVMVTEYGVCEADGDGLLDIGEAINWWRFLAAHDVSYINWSISNKAETAAALMPHCKTRSHWQTTDLTTTGKFVRNHLRLCQQHLRATTHNS